eukprot:3194129-Pyramimonas_sp.AAC.1
MGRCPLQGIKTSARGAVVAAPSAALQILAGHWRRVFEKKDINISAAHRYLRRYADGVDLSGVPPPSLSPLERRLERVEDRAPGLD